MKPAPFTYAAPSTVADALDELAAHGEAARALAGGQSLVPLLALRMARVERLVDLNRIDALTGIEEHDGALRIGAMTRQSTLERDALVRRAAPLISEATRLVGHAPLRNRGTIGGSLVHADPAAEYPAVAVTLDAEVEVASASGGTRRVAYDEMLRSAYMTALEPDELAVAVHVPAAAPRSGSAIEEIARRPGDFALAGACAMLSLDGEDRIAHARVVVFGVGPRAVRLTAVEDGLVGERAADAAVDTLCAEATAGLRPPSDVQADGAYRKSAARVVSTRVVARALSRALEGVT